MKRLWSEVILLALEDLRSGVHRRSALAFLFDPRSEERLRLACEGAGLDMNAVREALKASHAWNNENRTTI